MFRPQVKHRKPPKHRGQTAFLPRHGQWDPAGAPRTLRIQNPNPTVKGQPSTRDFLALSFWEFSHIEWLPVITIQLIEPPEATEGQLPRWGRGRGPSSALSGQRSPELRAATSRVNLWDHGRKGWPYPVHHGDGYRGVGVRIHPRPRFWKEVTC